MLSPKKCFAIIMIALLLTFASYIFITNMHLYDIIDLHGWNTTHVNGTNAEGTLVNGSIRDGGNRMSEWFIAPGAIAGTLRIGAGNTTLNLDPDQDPTTGQYGYEVNQSSNYANTEWKGQTTDAAIINRVKQNGNLTMLTQWQAGYNFQYDNSAKQMFVGCEVDTVVGYRCGVDVGHQNIYNSPDLSNMWSSGVISGGVLTHSGQDINITGGIVELRSTDQENGTLFPMSFSGRNYTFAVGQLEYIYLLYSGGTVSIQNTTSFIDINGMTSIEMYQVYQESPTTTLYIDARNQNIGLGNKLVRRFYVTDRFKHGTGAMIGTPSGLNITVTPGIFYYGVNSIDTPAFNTITGSTVEYYYRNGSGGFNASLQNYVNNTVYDSGTGTPTALLPNHYKTEFVFLEITSNGGDNIAIVMGQDEYVSQASAELASVPAVLPTSISNMGVLIGRVVVREGSPTIVSIASAFVQQFSPSLANQHNTLAGLDGGEVGWYGHNNISESYNISKIPLKLNISELNASVDSKVNKSGDTITGNLILSNIYSSTLDFNGVSSYIQFTSGQLVNNATDSGITYGGWFNSGIHSATAYIIDDYRGYYLFRTAAGLYVAQIAAGFGSALNQNGVVLNNEWHQIFVVANQTNLTIYIDGQLNATKAGTFNITYDAARVFTISKRDTLSSGYFNGSIDRILIYNRPLTSIEISNLYNGTYVNNSGMVLSLNMNEEQANTTYDNSGEDNHGILVNTSWAYSYLPFKYNNDLYVNKTGTMVMK